MTPPTSISSTTPSQPWRKRLGDFWRHRVRPGWQAGRWLIIGGLWLAALLLGYVGFAKHPDPLGRGAAPGPLDLLYLTLQLIPMNSGAVPPPVSWELQVSRLLIPAVAAYTVVQALADLFFEQFLSLRLRRIRGHVIICGLGRKGYLFARGFLARREQVVVIERDEDDPFIQPCRELGAIVLVGDATNQETLRRAGVARGRVLVIACGDDGVNADVAVNGRGLAAGRDGSPLVCLVHIVDPRLCDLLRERELAAQDADALRLEFFNVFDLGARALLQEHPPFGRGPAPHLLLVGMGSLGRSVAVRAARLWRERNGASGARLRITVVDREAEHKIELLRLRYPKLERVCELIPCPIDIRRPDFERGDFACGADGRCRVDAIYICLDNDSLGLAAGLTLLQKVRDQEVPVVVRMAGSTGMAALLEQSTAGSFANLRLFPLLDRICQPDLLLGGVHELLARAIHEDYVQQQMARGETAATNPVLAPWEELPESVREMNRRQADHVGVKLAAVGCGLAPLTDWDAESFRFAPEEVELLARLEHERFVADRRREGWTYAPGARSLTRKSRADLVPWEELPEVEREKDRTAVAGLPRFLAGAGLQVHRVRQVPS